MERQEDFAAGATRDVAPHLIPDNGCYDLVNGFYLEDGSPARRGGSAYESTSGLGSNGLTWVADLYMQPGQRTVFANSADFGVLDGSSAPVNLGSDGIATPRQWAYTDDAMFIGGGYIYGGSRKTANYNTGTVTVTNGSTTVSGAGTTWNTLTDAGMLLQIDSNERVYTVASIDSTTSLTLSTAYEGTTAAGKNYTLYPIYKITSADPYVTADYYAVVGNRLIWAIGNKVYLAPLTANTKTPHNHGTPEATDYHELPEGVQITGLAAVGQTALIFSTAGVWTLTGLVFDIVDAQGNPQHRLELLSKEVVLWGAPGLASAQQALIVPATDGLYLIDGVSRPEPISRPINELYTHYIASGYIAGQSAVYDNHFILPIIDSAAQVIDTLVCRLDRPVTNRGQVTFPWSRFTGDGGQCPAFAVRQTASAPAPKLLGAQKSSPSRVVNCSAFFRPDATFKNDADGSTHDLDIITRDYGDGTRNLFRKLRTRYKLIDAGSDGPTLTFDFSDGAIEGDTSGALWDEAIWDTDLWAAESDETIFANLACDAPVSSAREWHKCRVNEKALFGRFRIRTVGPSALCVIRGVEIQSRPLPSSTRR
jgi:hypothetical protein